LPDIPVNKKLTADFWLSYFLKIPRKTRRTDKACSLGY